MAAAEFVAALDGGGFLRAEGLRRMDGRAVFAVADEAAVAGVAAGGHGGAVDLGAARVDGMVPGEVGTLARQAGEGGGVLVVDDIRAQTVPDHDDDMFGPARGCGGGIIRVEQPRPDGEQTGEKEAKAFHRARQRMERSPPADASQAGPCDGNVADGRGKHRGLFSMTTPRTLPAPVAQAVATPHSCLRWDHPFGQTDDGPRKRL